MAAIVVEDIFEVQHKDRLGKVFDKVSRIEGKSDLYELDLQLDVNVDIYPMEVGEKFSLALSPTISLSSDPPATSYQEHVSNSTQTLMDSYDYVMHGKVYKYVEDAPRGAGGYHKIAVYISFGGLLMQLQGDAKKLADLDIDQNVYLLIRKVK